MNFHDMRTYHRAEGIREGFAWGKTFAMDRKLEGHLQAGHQEHFGSRASSAPQIFKPLCVQDRVLPPNKLLISSAMSRAGKLPQKVFDSP